MKVIRGWAVVIFCGVMGSSAAWSVDCNPCLKKKTEHAGHLADEVKYQKLLEANQRFLQGPGGKDPSKAIKVRSNVLILTLKIDTAKNEAETLMSLIKSQCGGC